MTAKNNDFFNLNSDDEDEHDDNEEDDVKKHKKKDLEKNVVNKWDWDREENFDLYFPRNYTNNKRSLVRAIDTETCPDKESNKRFKKPNENETFIDRNSNSETSYFVQRVNDDENSCSSSQLAKLKYNLVGHSSSVNRIHWSKQNNNIILSSSMDGKIVIWNLSKYSDKINPFVINDIHSKSIRNAIWSNSENEIVSVSYDKSCAITNSETGKEMNRLEYTNILTSITNHPTDDNLKLIGAKNEILAWDIRTKKHSKTYKSLSGQIQDLLFLNEDEFVSCGDVVNKESAEHSIIVWDFKSTANISNQIFHEKYISTCLKKHPIHSLFFAQTHGNYIAEFSTRSPFKMNKFKRFESHGHSILGYAIGFDVNSNGNLLASGSSDGCVYIYNYQSAKLNQKIEAFNRLLTGRPCMDAKFKPNTNEKVLCVSSWQGLIKIYEFE